MNILIIFLAILILLMFVFTMKKENLYKGGILSPEEKEEQELQEHQEQMEKIANYFDNKELSKNIDEVVKDTIFYVKPLDKYYYFKKIDEQLYVYIIDPDYSDGVYYYRKVKLILSPNREIIIYKKEGDHEREIIIEMKPNNKLIMFQSYYSGTDTDLVDLIRYGKYKNENISDSGEIGEYMVSDLQNTLDYTIEEGKESDNILFLDSEADI